MGTDETPMLVVVVLAFTHRYNAVRGHRTGSNSSGAEDHLRRKTSKKDKHTTTEINRRLYLRQKKKKNVRSAYVRIKIHIIF